MEYIKIIIEATIFAITANGIWGILEFTRGWMSTCKSTTESVEGNRSNLSSNIEIDIKMLKKNFDKFIGLSKDFGLLQRDQQELKDDLDKANKGFQEARSSLTAKGTMIEITVEKLARIEQSLKAGEVREAVEHILKSRRETEALVNRALNWRDECNQLAIDLRSEKDALIKRIEALEDSTVDLRQTINKK